MINKVLWFDFWFLCQFTAIGFYNMKQHNTNLILNLKNIVCLLNTLYFNLNIY